MAAPANLYRVDVSGRWEDLSFPAATKQWDWAMVWYVEGSLVTDDEGILETVAFGYMTLLRKGNNPDSWMTDGTVAERWRCVRVASGVFGERTEDVFFTGGGGGLPVAPQVALLVVGRTAKLGVQTRKWIPNIGVGNTDAQKPAWNVPLHSIFGDWVVSLLRPLDHGVMITTPVVYDEKNEVVNAITEIRFNATFRTIRRRALDMPDNWMVGWP